MVEATNQKFQKPTRQYLRNNSTLAERILWNYLKHNQIKGYKFRRQFGIENYVVDFYCPQLKLAIEVDGGSHFNPTAYKEDRIRQKTLELQGVRFLRFTNQEVYYSLEKVLSNIMASLP